MGRQIIKQPNGRFCVFSSIVDNVIWYDMEQKDIVEYLWLRSLKIGQDHTK